MLPNTLSQNIWDYLGDMPYMPSRQDRDELVQQAARIPKQEKRIHIWDYFFHARSEDVGKPHLLQVGLRTSEKDAKVVTIRAKAKQQTIFSLIVVAVTGLTALGAFLLLHNQTIELAADGFMILGLIALILVWQLSSREISRIERDWNEDATSLRKSVMLLQRQIPPPSTVDEMYRWLEEDIAWLSQHAIEQTGLDQKRVPLGDDTPNPICIIGPAYLQRAKLIPELLLSPREVDRGKHLAAARLDFFSDKRFIDLYGVYYVEFIIVTEDVLGNYGCFFDFITGRIYNEHTSEMYYNDVVALSTRQQYRKVDLPFFKMTLENAPTFSLSLSSSDSIQVTYASSEYIRNWFRRLMQAQQAEFEFDASHWVRNPETTADKAIKALRAQLRKRKGTDVVEKAEPD